MAFERAIREAEPTFDTETKLRTAQLIAKLKRYLEENPDNISFGPTYKIEGRNQEQLEASVIFFQNTNSNFAYKIILTNPQGEIKAFIDGHIRQDSGIVSKRVVTTERGKGYAVRTELISFDVLQRLANQTGTTMTNIVRNANVRRLTEAKEERTIFGSTFEIEKEIALLEEENKRWLALYGEKSILGFRNYRKEFYPSKEDYKTRIEDIDKVKLERTIDPQSRIRRASVIEESPITLEHRGNRRTKKMSELEILISRMREVVLG